MCLVILVLKVCHSNKTSIFCFVFGEHFRLELVQIQIFSTNFLHALLYPMAPFERVGRLIFFFQKLRD